MAESMALRDTWHRALVYFGLAEDHEYGSEYDEGYEPETGSEEVFEGRREREQSPVRRLPTARRSRRDEIDDIFADDEPISASRTRTLRPVANGGSDVQVHLVIPRNFNDAQQVADQFKRVGAGNPQPADHRPRALEADDRLLLRIDVRDGRWDAADRREDVPADASERRGLCRGTREIDRQGVLQPVLGRARSGTAHLG